jgi:hypothetical protein
VCEGASVLQERGRVLHVWVLSSALGCLIVSRIVQMATEGPRSVQGYTDIVGAVRSVKAL